MIVRLTINTEYKVYNNYIIKYNKLVKRTSTIFSQKKLLHDYFDTQT